MALLFEYHDSVIVQKPEKLKLLFQNIWKEYSTKPPDDYEIDINSFQPFLQFDGNNARANNYIGFIQTDDEIIEIYPKVFRKNISTSKELMLRHVFFWFSYCHKWRFPFNHAALARKDIKQFPELIIRLIADQILDAVSNHPFSMYQEKEETLTVPKGTLNFHRYIAHGLSHGNFHQLECDNEPFLYDNKANRIIKYCTRLLLSTTRFNDNLLLLQDIIFILDDVADIPCSIHDLDMVKINPFFQEYRLVLHSCRMILNQQLYSNNPYDLSQWCLLFPMEYIFEDFVAGFLQRHFNKDWNIEYHKSNECLTNTPKAFNMQHDIFLTERKGNRRIIIDTKYKLRDAKFKSEVKKGIAQVDLYQMLAYAYKTGCTEVVLLYPNLDEKILEPDLFKIESGFDNMDVIMVKAAEIHFGQ